MRTALTRDPTRVPLSEFFVPYTTSLSLNWPYGDAAIWEQQQQLPPSAAAAAGAAATAGGPPKLVMSAAFEAHVRDLGNWSLGPAFVRRFPDLVEGVRIEDRRRG